MFVDGRIAGEEFELLFLPIYKRDPTHWPAELFDVLDGLFGDVDEFCPDDLLRVQSGGIDETELRRRAARALERLSAQAGVPCD